MTDAAAVKERVQAYLTSAGPVQIDDKGRYSLESGSTRTFVEVMPHPDGKVSLVMVTAVVLFEVPLTPELFRHVALHTDDWVFGHLFVTEGEDGKGMVLMRHMLMGDYLDKDELMYVVFGITGVADDLDEKLKEQFGGKTYEES